MLKLRDLEQFHEYLESGGWADAFSYATEDLRMEMISLMEQLLDTADLADKIVGEVLFNKDGLGGGGEQGSSSILPSKEGAS